MQHAAAPPMGHACMCTWTPGRCDVLPACVYGGEQMPLYTCQCGGARCVQHAVCSAEAEDYRKACSLSGSRPARQ